MGATLVATRLPIPEESLHSIGRFPVCWPDVAIALQAGVAALRPNAKVARTLAHPLTQGCPLARLRFDGDPLLKIVEEVKSRLREHIVFVQCGFFWEVLADDAIVCSEIFGWRLGDGPSGVYMTGVPTNAFRFKQQLEDLGYSYVLVGQVASGGRAVVELHSAGAA